MTKKHIFEKMYIIPGLAIALGAVVVLVILLYIYIKCKLYWSARNEVDTVSRNSVPTYEEATKDDPPSYGIGLRK